MKHEKHNNKIYKYPIILNESILFIAVQGFQTTYLILSYHIILAENGLLIITI